ncbi:MAG TPA: NifB/NifX family molybdenum-iron cluster-binding protein [Treponemataceae bacterium]|nr:NifB/NifX family molybdenum-iron cluster-binding protein [Treponemataceae bacterium]
MKIAITSEGETLESMVDQRFGRAAKFIIFDTESETFTVQDNTQNLNAAQGAGIQSAQNVVDSGATALITGHTGPKAFRVLYAGKISIFLSKKETVKTAIDQWKKNELTQITEADVEGHWI